MSKRFAQRSDRSGIVPEKKPGFCHQCLDQNRGLIQKSGFWFYFLDRSGSHEFKPVATIICKIC
ncbi:hypothetical protein AM228_27505 [Planktothricoides sp. SR001]|nr:hypothetical protein AM228_27505 [Planktothricoides sp. SR001]